MFQNRYWLISAWNFLSKDMSSTNEQYLLLCELTPARTLSLSGLKSRVFKLKNDGKKWSRIYFEIDRAPSEIPAKLPGQFGQSAQILLHWAAATLKGHGQFQNKF